jgi:hypothetical protein
MLKGEAGEMSRRAGGANKSGNMELNENAEHGGLCDIRICDTRTLASAHGRTRAGILGEQGGTRKDEPLTNSR